MSLPTDERQTPRWFFRLCSDIWGPVDLDAFAARWNHQHRRYVTKEQDIYRLRPRADCAWTQPPYSRGQLGRAMGFARELVLARHWGKAICLVPSDPSTIWWKSCIARPEGRVVKTESLWQRYPAPLGEAYRITSQGLRTTIAFPDQRLAYTAPYGAIGPGAKQPSAVVVFETVQTSGRKRAQSMKDETPGGTNHPGPPER